MCPFHPRVLIAQEWEMQGQLLSWADALCTCLAHKYSRINLSLKVTSILIQGDLYLRFFPLDTGGWTFYCSCLDDPCGVFVFLETVWAKWVVCIRYGKAPTYARGFSMIEKRSLFCTEKFPFCNILFIGKHCKLKCITWWLSVLSFHLLTLLCLDIR